MSPAAAHGGSKGKESGTARVLGSGTSGILELLGFHPIDTVAKRLMNNKSKIFVPGMSRVEARAALRAVIFKEAANKGTLAKYLSLFPGLSFAAAYKVLQRVYKFGGQPFVNEYLTTHHTHHFQAAFGERNAKTMMHATSGSLIGIGEIALLPLDALKIKMQTNAGQYAGQSVTSIIRSEGLLGLYRGAGWTAARNAPGSFALFGGNSIVYEKVFGLEDYKKATFFQTFVASVGGAIASITISAPLDVIKTRIQARSKDQAESGMQIVRNMIRNEGVLSFFKGLTPKLLVVGPKLVFSFTVAQRLIPLFDDMLKKN